MGIILKIKGGMDGEESAVLTMCGCHSHLLNAALEQPQYENTGTWAVLTSSNRHPHLTDPGLLCV